ncbi:MAG: YceD family protein [Sarcina sp.]
MEFKFSEMTSKKEKSKVLDFTFERKEIIVSGEIIKVIAPIAFKGDLKVIEDVVEIAGNVKTTLELQCSRCLKNFSYKVDIDFNEKFSNNYKEDDDIALVEEDILDIFEVIMNNVISTLPIKRLCTDKCKGLCQSCGMDLNKSSCNCDNDNIDLRFDSLKDLFTNKEV